MKEDENIKRILNETLLAIQKNDSQKLNQLSNQTIHSASITQDQDNILVAVIVYSLGKIFQRSDYRKLKGWNAFEKITRNSIEHSIEDVKNKKYEHFRKDFQIISKAINKVSPKLKKYISEVYERAKVSKASRIHEHGISLGQTANLLGTTQYELASYAGQTGISEVKFNKTIRPKQRIKFLEGFFK